MPLILGLLFTGCFSGNLIANPGPELTSKEELEATKVVSDFLEAKTVEERLAHVRDPKRVKPLMEKWYKDRAEAEALPRWRGPPPRQGHG